MTFDEEVSFTPCLHLLDDETWPLEASYTLLEHDVTHMCDLGGLFFMCYHGYLLFEAI
jgi:hypothetical protein